MVDTKDVLRCPCASKDKRLELLIKRKGRGKNCTCCGREYSLHMKCSKQFWVDVAKKFNMFEAGDFQKNTLHYFFPNCHTKNSCVCRKTHNGGEDVSQGKGSVIPLSCEIGHNWGFHLKKCYEKQNEDFPKRKRKFICYQHITPSVVTQTHKSSENEDVTHVGEDVNEEENSPSEKDIFLILMWEKQ